MNRFHFIFLIICSPCLIYPGRANAGLFGPSSFDECILDKMPGVSSNTAAAAIWLACKTKFPSANSKDSQYSPPPQGQTPNNRSVEDAAGEVIGDYWSHLSMLSQCTESTNPEGNGEDKDNLRKINDMANGLLITDVQENSNIVDAVEHAVVEDRLSRGLPSTVESVKDQVSHIFPLANKVAKIAYNKYVDEWGSRVAACRKFLPFVASNMSIIKTHESDLRFLLGSKFYLYKFKIPGYGEEIKE